MASCSTPQWSTSYTPQARLTVTQSASTATDVTLSWTLEYVAYGYAASVSKSRAYTVTIDGSVVKEGTFAINGVKNTTTITSGTVKINKGTAARTVTFGVSFVFNLTWTDVYGGTKTASGSISVGAKTSYTVSYNANGGSGAPSSQTKWYGTTLKLSSTIPTRTGYTFKGWATSSGGSVVYAAGANYTGNTALSLYAVWQINTWSVTYNANGGSGAPATQTKTYGQTLKLSTTIPTLTNYTFKGWATSDSASTAVYQAGDNYTTDAALSLYAVWVLSYVKPRINNLSIERCNSSGTISDDGTYALVSFKWACDRTISSIVVEWESETYGSGSKSLTISGTTSGTINQVIGNGALNTDATYTMRVIVTDANGYTYGFGTLSGSAFALDFLAGGLGAAFGKPAELSGVLDIGFQTRFFGGILHPELEPETDLNNVRIPNTYIGANISTNNYANCPLVSGTFTLTVEGAGEEGQVKQILTRCSKTEPERYIRFYYQNEWSGWMPDATCTIYIKETGKDLNDYKETGTYYFNTSHTPTNIPSGCVNGWLVVIRADSGAIKQFWHRYGTFGTNDFNTYVRTGNASTWSAWKRYSVEPEVLFSGNADGTLTLSETAANFAYLEIFFTDNNGLGGGYTKLSSPNGTQFSLSCVEHSNTSSAGSGHTTYIRSTKYFVNGTTMRPVSEGYTQAGYLRVNNTGTSAAITHSAAVNYIRITKILGHRA